jgi:exopolysaccharide production protein ExoQ
LSEVFDLDISIVSLHLFGDPTFTGRTSIWAFALDMIERRPLLGWGYQSYWLVGPDAPSVLEAPGWVAEMPNAHNGYLDTILETGLLGLAVLTTFIIATRRRTRAASSMACTFAYALHHHV